MQRPAELQQLVDELRAEKPKSSVITVEASKLVIAVEDTEDRHEFTAEEAELVLANRDTVDRLFEAMDYPEETFVELHNMTVDEEVMAELEKFSGTVDEM